MTVAILLAQLLCTTNTEKEPTFEQVLIQMQSIYKSRCDELSIHCLTIHTAGIAHVGSEDKLFDNTQITYEDVFGTANRIRHTRQIPKGQYNQSEETIVARNKDYRFKLFRPETAGRLTIVEIAAGVDNDAYQLTSREYAAKLPYCCILEDFNVLENMKDYKLNQCAIRRKGEQYEIEMELNSVLGDDDFTNGVRKCSLTLNADDCSIANYAFTARISKLKSKTVTGVKYYDVLNNHDRILSKEVSQCVYLDTKNSMMTESTFSYNTALANEAIHYRLSAYGFAEPSINSANTKYILILFIACASLLFFTIGLRITRKRKAR